MINAGDQARNFRPDFSSNLKNLMKCGVQAVWTSGAMDQWVGVLKS